MLVSPTEPPELRAIGEVSWKAEDYGADILITRDKERIGIQRKEVMDLLGSVENKLLGKQLNQMAQLRTKILLIEGRMQFTLTGEFMGKSYGEAWNQKKIWGLLMSIQRKGVWIITTENLSETVECVQYLEGYFKKKTHRGLDVRGGVSSPWGKPTNREYAVYMLQGLPMIGPEIAERIYDTFGLPLRLTVTPEQLMEIDGIGEKKARAIWEGLNDG